MAHNSEDLSKHVPSDKIDGNLTIKLEGVNLPLDDVDRTELQLNVEDAIIRMLRREFNATPSDDAIENRNYICRRDTLVVVNLHDVADDAGINHDHPDAE